jgi:PHD/YefM family antitoxin component YafN of YafNO toxin-antitoxin module
MVPLHPEFVVDKKAARKAVILPFAEWQRLMEEIEELEDIRAYDKAKAEAGGAVPFEETVKRIRGRAKK